jgi:hypothetical protein
VDQGLVAAHRELQQLPKAVAREDIAEYVRDQLDLMSRDLYDVSHSTDVGGSGDTYTTGFKKHICELSR